MVAGSTKRLASRFYQVKKEHCLSGQYLNWTKNRPTLLCWWYRHPIQTREHLFKVSPEWKGPAEVPVRGGADGDRKVEGWAEDPGPPG